jgi:hypothetical protein
METIKYSIVIPIYSEEETFPEFIKLVSEVWMFSWIGFRQIAVSYTQAPRRLGRGKYPLRKMLRFASDGIDGLSAAPLRLVLAAGLLLAAASAPAAQVPLRPAK